MPAYNPGNRYILVEEGAPAPLSSAAGKAAWLPPRPIANNRNGFGGTARPLGASGPQKRREAPPVSKADLQRDLRALYREAGDGQTLPVLMDGVCAALARHPDALAGITGRYAVLAADTGFACAFALSSGVFSPLAPDAPVDVSIVGGEADLLAVFRHELAPLKALLGGKVRVRGDRAALMRFAPFL